jgi:tetratricopeptide (TPR) repeat protein
VPPATVLGAPKKSKKPLFITLGIAAAVIVLAIAAAIGFDVYRSSSYSNAVANLEAGDYQAAYDAFVNLGDYENAPLLLARAQNGLDYNAAQALLDAEDYEGALAAFDALKGFKDSVDKAALCQNTLDYRAAIEDFEAGDLEAAFDAFSALTTAGFSDSAEWADKTAYAIADQSYEAGDHYAAYQGFKELGSYKDAAERMQQCTTPYPETGEYYHNEAYVSTSSAIVIDAANASYASYYKIYSGSDLVSAIFLNPGASHMTELPPGNYTLKEASGDVWFGEEIMFGDEGYYDVLVFDDGNDYFTLDHNVEVTITLSVASGDIKSSPTDREDF